MSKRKIIIVSGLALFAMFVGAGNPIFPPQLGAEAGSAYLPATLGFLSTGIGLVFMGVVATTRAGGNIMDLGHHLGKVPISLFSVLAMLAIGPGLAIPRTAATTYEFLKGSLIPAFPAWLSSAIFFSIVLFFVFRPSRVVDLIGNFLTPGLIFVLAIIIIKGLITPLGEIIPTGMEAVFSTSFEKGYQTIVGSGGSNLSGGERQRITIARAMLKNAPILILDEATAYIDPENEVKLQESISKLIEGKTVIIIAHRLSTVTDVDKIFLVEDGIISCAGNHEELLNKSNTYKDMWRANLKK